MLEGAQRASIVRVTVCFAAAGQATVEVVVTAAGVYEVKVCVTVVRYVYCVPKTRVVVDVVVGAVTTDVAVTVLVVAPVISVGYKMCVKMYCVVQKASVG
jgi:hypothetical protein